MQVYKEKKFAQLNDLMEQKCVCKLKKRANRTVIGAGNVSARIMFIGEAPGAEEDRIGAPFVGASGRVLNELLKSISLKRDDVYITNIVKYRPPNNRDPYQKEITECLPWLYEQINFIKPIVIVPLGRYALNLFITDYKISQSHGKVFFVQNEYIDVKICYALYHPAVSLYNPRLKKILFDDFARIPYIIKQFQKIY